jgi:Holliday junction resolvase-like predicted endonuclease
MMNTIEKGRLGEAAVVKWFVEHGYEIYSPLFGNTSNDLVVAQDGTLYRVEIKCSGKKSNFGSYEVQLRSSRPNRTGTVIKKFDGNKSDLLAVYLIHDDKVVILESKLYDGRTSVNLIP